MSKPEIRMNDECTNDQLGPSSFGFGHSFGFLVSGLVIPVHPLNPLNAPATGAGLFKPAAAAGSMNFVRTVCPGVSVVAGLMTTFVPGSMPERISIRSMLFKPIV